MKQVRFTIEGEPKGKGRPRFIRGTGHTYTPRETANYEVLTQMEYHNQCTGFRFDEDSMLDMRIMAFYSIPKSVSKKRRAQMMEGLIRPTKKPDMDNVVKIIADALNGVSYKDDTQIVDVQCRKFYSDVPRVEVRIIEVGKDPAKKKKVTRND